VRYNADTGEITLTFADEVALDLATGRPHALVLRQLEIVRDSALAFVLWEYALVRTYMAAEGHGFGDPIVLR
jgi:hypothetical protein